MLTRGSFTQILDYWQSLNDFTQEAIIAGVNSRDWNELNRFTDEHLGPMYRNEFRDCDLAGVDDHIGQMAIRIVHHYLMGGWGLEDPPGGGVLLEGQVTV
ncbi:MAG: hypothetical protein KJ041_01250 [Gammaproteobacteria bacterium]|nr:hypothetical protein [Gammaproteobacteria bacterium]